MDPNVNSTQTGGSQYVGDIKPLDNQSMEQVLLSLQAVDHLDPGYVAGEAVESYNAPPNNPSLPNKVKVDDKGKKGKPQPNASSLSGQTQIQFNNYVTALPPALQKQVNLALKQPQQSRDPEINALINTMQTQSTLATYAKATSEGRIAMSQVPIALRKELIAYLQSGGSFSTDVQGILAKTTPLTQADITLLTAVVDTRKVSSKLKTQAQAKLDASAGGGTQVGGEVKKASLGGTQPLEGVGGKTGSPPQEGVGGKPGTVPLENIGAKAGTIPPENIGAAPGTPPPPLGTMGLQKVDPNTMMPDQMAGAMRQNGIQMLDNTQFLIQKTLDGLDPNDPAKPVLADFLGFIAKIISECKAFMAKLSSMDAEEGKKAAVGQREVTERKLEKQLEQIKKAQEARKKQAMMGLLGKILGPIFAVLMLAAVIVTGGSVIAIIIAVVVLLATLLDAATGVVSEGMKALMKAMEDMLKAMGLPDSVAKALTAVVMVAAIIVAVVFATGAASSASASLVKSVGQAAADKIARMVAVGVAVNAGVFVATTSNCIASGFSAFAEMCGASEEIAEIIGMIMQIIILLVAMLAGGAAMGNAAGKLAEFPDAISAVRQLISDALNITAGVMTTATGLAKGVMNAKCANLAIEQAELDSIITLLDTLIKVADSAKKSREEGIQQLMDMGQFFSDSFEQLIKSHEKILQGATAA